MKNTHKHFMQNRQVFMAGGPEGQEVEKKAPTNPLADAFEANANKGEELKGGDDKMKTKYEAAPISPEDLAKKSKGHPEVAINDSNKQIVAKLKDAFKTANKKDMEHLDAVSISQSGDYEYVLIHDGTKKPPERLFKSKEKAAEAKADIDLDDAVGSMIKPYSELATAETDYKTYAAMLKGKVKNHGDSQSYIDAKNNGFVLLKDDNAKDKNGYRVFKGKPV